MSTSTTVPSLLYSEDEGYLRDAVRALLAGRTPLETVLRRTDEADAFTADAQQAWRGLVDELGVVGLAVPEELGGAGASWREVAVVMEELGRAVADVPYLTSAVAATSLAVQLGADALVRELVSGEAIGTIVTPYGAPLRALDAEVTYTDGKLSGTVRTVAGALEATVLLVPIGHQVLLVQRDQATVEPVLSFDMTRRISDVTFDQATAAVLADDTAEALSWTADIACALLASEQLGIAEATLEMTVEYLGQRRQFGRIIGSYQALKHRLADVWTEIAKARAVARYAADCAATGTDLPIAASVAASICGDAALLAAEECVQLHGGIGFTWEHPAHLFLKRARADALAYGTPTWHRTRLGGLVDLVAR